ncbi:hypothetical protein GGU10DRAFT_369374 [Lentinula aff. detonsa]|uniref:Uncharacterized protein n=1 Tax=Lentinula aff. detonsa TaxID=2804958 RepID=A0AA38L1S8_9AGAR|nr:hypothetical protein GGU10DRAFT_369374 [Lentinula aff. detonsa]
MKRKTVTFEGILAGLIHFASLLQLHRRPFMELLNHPQQFDWKREFAPSVLPTYLSTASIITAVETLFNNEEQPSGRFDWGK